MEHFDNTIGSKVRPVRMIHNSKATIRTISYPPATSFVASISKSSRVATWAAIIPGEIFQTDISRISLFQKHQKAHVPHLELLMVIGGDNGLYLGIYCGGKDGYV